MQSISPFAVLHQLVIMLIYLQELIIQSRMYDTGHTGQGTNGYQNPVFDMTETNGDGDQDDTTQGWSRVKEQRPKRWSFGRSNSGRFEPSARVCPIPSPSR